MRRPSGFSHCESGSAAVEFAMVGLTVILLAIGIIEFGRGLYLRNELTYLVDLAARRILIRPGVPDDRLQDEIRSAFSGNQHNLQVTITTETVEEIPFRTVSVSYPLELLVPGLHDGRIVLQAHQRVPELP
ncbi:TadE/TadG family type IV pilus assembly protein [Microvirga massiliensis]|uniref:TadE/TadG family type IV pilus assembly protein n=1 Tax=Microvirga massiliensis TaxID=1033741 RepID=UPI00244EDAAB|nr:TadE/TadG family type IV pilus assembly protein [Microvirga massiliensis]